MDFKRTHILDELISTTDNKLIKILIGIRRVGKSYILEMFQKYLIKLGNFENCFTYDFNDKVILTKFNNWKKLYKDILKQSVKNKINYVFLDEIQLIKNFPDLIITLYANKEYKYDIYITGSNATLLSTELGTNFTGRHYDIKIWPITFKEFFEYNIHTFSKNEMLEFYIRNGGMGIIIPSLKNEGNIKNIIKVIYHDCLLKDIKQRYKIKNITELEELNKYLFDTIGNPISIEKMEQWFKKNKNSKITKMTIQKYIKHLCDAFILKKINYYDIRGSKIINSSPKYYATDLGILYLNHNYKYYYNFGYKLENLVLLELLNSKYEVYTHITKNKKEIDFVAIKDNKTTFIQVCETINSEEVFKREFGNLKDVGKTGKKLVLSLDNTLHNECDDIEHKNIVEWLLENK